MLFPARSTQRTASRMQFMAHAVLLAFVAGWLLSFLPCDDLLNRQGTPLGADFSMFYVAGQLVSDGDADRLYDQAEHQQRLHGLFPGLDKQFCLPYRYPPLVAAVFAPLARQSYPFAYAVFFLLSLGVWLLTLRLLAIDATWRTAEFARPLWWALAACPVALETFIGGQASAFAALLAVASVLLVRHQRFVWAGAVLALAAYKPNVLLLFAVGLTIRYPRILLGALPVAASFVGACYAVGGERLLGDYIGITLQLTGGPWDVETPLWKVHGLASWFNLITPERGRAFATMVGFAASIAVAVWWRMKDANGSCGLNQAAAALLVINALCNPYTPIYDLLLLAPAVVFALNAFRTKQVERRETNQRNLQWLFVAMFFGPHISQAIAKFVGVQFFPIVLASIAVWLWNASSPSPTFASVER